MCPLRQMVSGRQSRKRRRLQAKEARARGEELEWKPSLRIVPWSLIACEGDGKGFGRGSSNWILFMSAGESF